MKYLKPFDKFIKEFKFDEPYLANPFIYLLQSIYEDIKQRGLFSFKSVSIAHADWSLNLIPINVNTKEAIELLKKSKWINNIIDNDVDFNFLPPFENLKDEIYVLFEASEFLDNNLYIKLRIDN